MSAESSIHGAPMRVQPATLSAATRAEDAARLERDLERARSAAANLEGVTVARPSLVVVQPGTPAAPPTPAPPPVELPGGARIQNDQSGTTIIRPDGQRTEIRPEAGGGVQITTPDGRTLHVGPNGVTREARTERVQSVDFPSRNNDIPPEVIPLVGTIFGTVAATIILFPIARAWARRMDRRAVPPSPDVTGRLGRIEQAVDAIAVEMERVSEAQRYSARLLTERLPESVAVVGQRLTDAAPR